MDSYEPDVIDEISFIEYITDSDADSAWYDSLPDSGDAAGGES